MKSILLPLSLAVALSACKPASEADTPAPASSVESRAVAASNSAPGMPPVAPNAETQNFHYQCGDLLVSARAHRDEVHLSFSGRDIALPQVPSASGTRYGDGGGNEFWSRGEEAMLTLDDKEHGVCTRSERASPWVEAQSRNIGFRAVGGEPGWYVEVGRGEAPMLHAQLDYGERKIDVPSVQPLKGAISGFRGMTTDGATVELRIARTACNDGMSGEAFEASAELVVAERSYTGCGAYLFE
ncbi:MAG: MliC family protein [Luteimonas sp.]